MPYKQPVQEPIAVVGSSCRFAGGATSPRKLWEFLRHPSDVSRSVPPGRFQARAFYHPDGENPGTTDAQKAYWLDDDQDVRAFDAAFFGMAPKEAEAVDPQQRLLLEAVYEALESSGYQLSEWSGKDVAVYVGAMTSDYDIISQRDDLGTSPYYATGNARSILANRISYFYDFRGASVTIDTACSSSLVALHQAVLSLRAGHSSAACVAGVNLMLAPEQFLVESSLHMLSPSGYCHMWDSRADGYARGEGTAVLLLKPLARALAEGDGPRIQALIRQTDVGSDGRTAGITMPSPETQASLIRSTFRRAGLDITDPHDRCQYFEAHGTGTPVGDPREAQAIYTAFFGEKSSHRESRDTGAALTSNIPPPLLVGSVKTLIGHTEGAAGLAGVMKVILAMKHAKVPPNMHLQQLNPNVVPFCTPASHGYLCVPTELVDWPAVATGQPRRASVNSFGFGGTNAHAILEHFDPAIHCPFLPPAALGMLDIHSQTPQGDLPPIPLLLSATSGINLRILAIKYMELLKKQGKDNAAMSLAELSWCTYKHRTPFPQRLALTLSSNTEAITTLSSLLSDISGKQVRDFGSRARRIEFAGGQTDMRVLGIFTGQGAQWPGMSKCLFPTNHIYRDTIRSLDCHLQTCPYPPSWSLEAELQKLDSDGSRVHEAAISQPLCTALQIALVDVLASIGIRFSCVLGHSSGEIAAAYAAKRLSSKDAILIAYYRGRSVSIPVSCETPGAMLAVGMSRADASSLCQSYTGRLCVAASNSPSSTTLSGDVDAVEEVHQQLKDHGVFVRRLRVDKAYHSHHMERFGGEYSEPLSSCGISPLRSTEHAPLWISSVRPDGSSPSTTELERQYWVDNMVSPVLFREAVEKVLSTGPCHFDCAIEVGPHPALKGPFLDTAEQFHSSRYGTKVSLPYTSLLQRGKNDSSAFADFISFMWTQFEQTPLQLDGLLDSAARDTLHGTLSRMHAQFGEPLPSFPWDHSQTYYRESRISRQFHHRPDAPHELLGSRTRDDVDGCELRWRTHLLASKIPWLAHHSFQGQPLLPASAYCIMALDAAKVLLAGRPASIVELTDVDFISGIPLDVDGPATEIMFSLAVQSWQMKDISLPITQLDKAGEGRISASFSVYAGSETSTLGLRKRCTGNIQIALGTPSTDVLPTRTVPDEHPEMFDVSTDAFYKMMAALGLQYSGPFRALESIQRRHNAVHATLKRLHDQDTTSLSFSPATLDSCLQTCFATFSSPGDNALWTVFLPIHLKRVSFNMAQGGVSGKPNTPRSTRLDVDALFTTFHAPTHKSPARITGDICIYDTDGNTEIQVEGLSVGSLAASHPSADRELYLYTMYQHDPEDCFPKQKSSQFDDNMWDDVNNPYFEEQCERVMTFYQSSRKAQSGKRSIHTAWPCDTEEEIEKMILTSPFSITLDNVRALTVAEHFDVPLADNPGSPLQAVVAQGGHIYQFQQQVASIITQICHRYPSMSVIGLTGADMRLTTPILQGLGTSFSSYTSVLQGQDRVSDWQMSQLPPAVSSKIRSFSLSRTDDLKMLVANGSSIMQQYPFDLVISTTSTFKHMNSSSTLLEQIKKLMRPGGFILLLHIPVKLARISDLAPTSLDNTIITPPDWPDLLHQHGFTNQIIQGTDQHYPGGFSITIRQSDSIFKKTLARMAATPPTSLPPFLFDGSREKLLIIGGETTQVRTLAISISQLLFPNMGTFIHVATGMDDLGNISLDELVSFSSVILLADLDDSCPILSTLDDQRLDFLRQLLLQPDMTMLWVTRGARKGNAENAASYGFARSIRAEAPRLVLQMLDFDDLYAVNGRHCSPGTVTSPHLTMACIIARVFLQLKLGARHKRLVQESHSESHVEKHPEQERPEPLWVLEPEIFIDDNGDRLIPRILPFRPANIDFNSARRVVTEPVNSAMCCVEISRGGGDDGTMVSRLGPSLTSLTQSAHPDDTLIKVYYSVAIPFSENAFLCIGRDKTTGNTVAATAKRNASYVTVPRCSPFAATGGYGRIFVSILIRMLFCYMLVVSTDGLEQVVLVAPDALLRQCTEHVATNMGRGLLSISVDKARIRYKGATGKLIIHPQATVADVKSILSRLVPTAVLIDLLPSGHRISKCLHSLAQRLGHVYLTWTGTNLASGSMGEEQISHVWQQALHSANDMAASINIEDWGTYSTVTVPALLGSQQNTLRPFQVVDWLAERVISHALQSLGHAHDATARLRGDRTYVLVGITRDMGQSLATLLVAQGARHIVLASRRTQDTKPRWAKALVATQGVNVKFFALDVTDLDAVCQFRRRIEEEENMPRVGGIVNGAMVLIDGVFAHMSASTFARVMRPKTVGSRNLDLVFHDDDDDDDNQLEFFIMTSSFAAVGGHAGQSNYAAANMFMNGVAADRQRRGVAGSILNIGVVYGLGFLHREKDKLYASLEREGYPPVSERDLHHMFLEAVRLGRPKRTKRERNQTLVDLTTGLSRFNPKQTAEEAMHWHVDPRFSHFTRGMDDDDAKSETDAAVGAHNRTKRLTDMISQGTVTAEELGRVLMAAFSERLATLLHLEHADDGDSDVDEDRGRSNSRIRGDSSLVELGVDSLVAVETRMWLWRTTGRDVPVMRILGATSIDKLCMDIARDIVASKST